MNLFLQLAPFFVSNTRILKEKWLFFFENMEKQTFSRLHIWDKNCDEQRISIWLPRYIKQAAGVSESSANLSLHEPTVLFWLQGNSNTFPVMVLNFLTQIYFLAYEKSKSNILKLLKLQKFQQSRQHFCMKVEQHLDWNFCPSFCHFFGFCVRSFFFDSVEKFFRWSKATLRKY